MTHRLVLISIFDLRRVLKPPGGEDSDIFGVRMPSAPSTPLTASPRRSKVKSRYQESSLWDRRIQGIYFKRCSFQGPAPSIFGYGDEIDRTSVSSGASTPRRKMSTSSQERLFGSEEFSTPRRVVDRMKSSVFVGQRSAPSTPIAANKKYSESPKLPGGTHT